MQDVSFLLFNCKESTGEPTELNEMDLDWVTVSALDLYMARVVEMLLPTCQCSDHGGWFRRPFQLV